LYSFSSGLITTCFNAITSCWASCCSSQKERDEKHLEKDSQLIYDLEAGLAAADFFLFNPIQTKPNLFTTISLSV
jgi:hypothetical protein